MSSLGSRSRSALTTVRPPMPESKTPMGRGSLIPRENSSRSRQAASACPLSLLKGRGEGEGFSAGVVDFFATPPLPPPLSFGAASNPLPLSHRERRTRSASEGKGRGRGGRRSRLVREGRPREEVIIFDP